MKKLLTKAFATFITLLLVASSAPLAHAGVVVKPIVATGGTITTVVENGITYKVHTFNSSGTFRVTSGSGKVWYLVVAGGGGGGGGGGGAGGYRSNVAYDYSVSPNSYTVTVGGGGAGSTKSGSPGATLASNGNDSVFATITSTGGGYGGSQRANAEGAPLDGNTGGSGGGGSVSDCQGGCTAGTGAAGTGGQGNTGGAATVTANYGGGGGGGAAAVGGNGSGTNGGTGGAGVSSSISGSSVCYAGGGGGGLYLSGTGGTATCGGAGGGSNGGSGSSATANTGGGGGGGGLVTATGGSGGSGVVLIRYPVVTTKVNSSQNLKLISGLVGLWSFDAGDLAGTVAYDRSGNGNNGTLTNGPMKVLGKIGQALSFNGTNQSVSIPNQDRTTFTASIWIKRLGGFGTGSSQRVIMGRTSGWAWYIENTDTFEFGKAGVSAASPRSSTPITDSNWHHVAITYNGSTVSYYIDGRADGSASYSTTFNNGSLSYGIGTDPFYGGFFNGFFDDVRIYNRVLSLDEIKRLYNEGASKTNSSQNLRLNSGLVGLWSFDAPDIAGVTAYDRSGSGNNGTLTNGPTRILGKIGQALNLDGSDDHIVAGSTNIPTGSSARTVSFWAKPTSATTAYVMSYGGVGDNLLFGVTNNAGTWVFQGHGPGDLSSGVTVSVNVWTYISITYDGTTVKIYINGSLANSGARSLNTSASSFYIGQYLTGIQRFPGLVDDMRVYNRALSPDEIKRLYNLGR